jgi:hypothetical protein
MAIPIIGSDADENGQIIIRIEKKPSLSLSMTMVSVGAYCGVWRFIAC